MKDIIIFIGSRSNYGRLYPLILGILEKRDFCVTLIKACGGLFTHIGEDVSKHKNLKEIIEIEADMYNDKKENMALTAALIMIQMSNILKNNKYQLAIVHGDRFETLGFAIATSFQNIPLIHMEAGEYSGNIDNKIRWAISAMSDLQACPTWRALEKMRRINLFNPYFLGCPETEYILKNKQKFKSVLYDKNPIYIVIVYHPIETKKELQWLIKVLKEQTIPSYWINPNLDPGNKNIVKAIKDIDGLPNLNFIKNLEMDEYLTLIANSKCIIGNTSSGIKEGAVLEVPYLLLSNRQQQREVDKNVIYISDEYTLRKELKNCINDKYQSTYEGLFGRKGTVDTVIGHIYRCLNMSKEVKA